MHTMLSKLLFAKETKDQYGIKMHFLKLTGLTINDE